MTRLFDGIFWPFMGLDPLWSLTLISFATGILMLWIFGKVSDQDRIKVVRDNIRGNLLGQCIVWLKLRQKRGSGNACRCVAPGLLAAGQKAQQGDIAHAEQGVV